MDNCKKFSDLTVRLQELFKSACLLDTDKYMRFSGVQVPESLDVFETFTAGLIPNVEVPYEEE